MIGASALLMRELRGFLRDSTPGRRRQRYGDMDYDWEHRVNTTSGTVGWRERLLGVFLSPYQPTDPALFAEMMTCLPIDSCKFTFADLGSGKGRTLLMASEYPFQKIIGVEILPELNRAAEENVRTYQERLAASARQHGDAETREAASPRECDRNIECICGDAEEYEFPAAPLVLYLFNPVWETGLARVLGNLERSLREHPREVYVLYHNPLLEHVLARTAWLRKVAGSHQFSVYAAAIPAAHQI